MSLCCGHTPAPEGFYCWVGDGEGADAAGAGRELEVHPHPSISQLGAARWHRPAEGTMAGMAIWGQPEDRLRLRSPSRNGDTSLHSPRAAFPGGHQERISSCTSQVGWIQHWQVGFSRSPRGSGGRGQAGKCRVQAAACPFCQPATRPPDPALPGPAGLSRTDRKSLCHFSGRR